MHFTPECSILYVPHNLCSIQRHKGNYLCLALFRSWQTTNPEGTVSPHDLNRATTALAFRTIRQCIGYNDAFNQQGESYTMDHDVYDFQPGQRKHSFMLIHSELAFYLTCLTSLLSSVRKHWHMDLWFPRVHRTMASVFLSSRRAHFMHHKHNLVPRRSQKIEMSGLITNVPVDR